MIKRNRYNWIILGWALVIMSIPGCLKERTETATKGKIIIVVAESVFPLIKQEELRFEDLYPEAHIDLVSSTTREAITRLFNDTIQVIVTSRALNAEEREVAKKYNIKVEEYKIAIDGIAILVNRQNPVAQLRTTQLDSIFKGTIDEWSGVGGKNTPIEVCLPDPNSGNYEVVGLKVLHGGKYATRTNVAKNSEDMLQFIADHTNAIGMVGLNWISTKKESVKVLELNDPSAPDSLGIRDKYLGPFQAHVYRGYYPITRDIYMYSRADIYSVGSGFISFITSAPGQQIVLNNGLVPATMPVRLVQLTNKDI